MKAGFNPLLDQGGAMNVICGKLDTDPSTIASLFKVYTYRETHDIPYYICQPLLT